MFYPTGCQDPCVIIIVILLFLFIGFQKKLMKPEYQVFLWLSYFYIGYTGMVK